MHLNNRQKTSFIFYGVVASFIALMSLIVVLFINIFPTLNLALTNRGSATCDCANHISYLTSHPFVGGFVIFLVASISLFVLFILYQAIKNIISTRRYMKSILENEVNLSTRVLDISISIGVKNKIVEVDSGITDVFCFGFFKPKICVSSELSKQVSKKQLRAILLHEKNHIVSHDPLKLFIVKEVYNGLFFIPGIKKLINFFIINIELLADERATNNFEEIRSLGNALLKLSDNNKNHPDQETQNLAISFLSITELRIDRLINKSSSPSLKGIFPKFSLSILIFASLFVVIFNSQVWLAQASQMDDMDSALSCHTMPEVSQLPMAWQQDSSSCVHNFDVACTEEKNITSSSSCGSEELQWNNY